MSCRVRRRAASMVGLVALLTLSAGSALSLSSSAAGAVAPAAGVNVRRSGPVGVATFVTPERGEFIPVAGVGGARGGKNVPIADRFWAQYGHLFGIGDAARQLRSVSIEVDALGQAHTTYQQYHHDVPVFSGVVKLHQDAQGNVLSANGRFYPLKPGLGVTPSIDAGTAVERAQQALAGPRLMLRAQAEAAAAATAHHGAAQPVVEEIELTIVDPGWYGDAPTGARLAYRIILTDLHVALRESLLVDAHTGEIIDRWSLIEQLLNREVFDGQQQAPIPGLMARDEGDPAVANADIDRAYDYAGDFYNFLMRGFGRDSIDNAGFTLRLTVHSQSTGCPNAYWNGMQSVYCTGVVTDDIVAHELAHGLVGNTAKLIYQNQSGQLNESFADVFGELVDLYNGDAIEPGTPGSGPGPFWPDPPASGAGTDAPNNLRTACSPRPSHPDGVRWCIGEDSAGFSGALREMYDPTCRSHPDRASSTLMVCPSINLGGVHIGSGVPNKGFAMLVDGGVFNGRTITGIGAVKAGAIWYRALTTYLTPASDFIDAYDALVQSANDLVGVQPNDPRTGMPSGAAITVFDVQQLVEALQAVELNTSGACGQTSDVLNGTPPMEGAAATMLLDEDFESGVLPAGWSVSNSAPPTPYDWVVETSGLPWWRPGSAVHCATLALGDCQTTFEQATHEITSPAISVPSGAGRVVLSFTHYLASEGRYDGGILEVSVNGGAWMVVPRNAFEFNPYNGRLYTAMVGNTNPRAGSDAFTGMGGRWGRSVVNLNGFAPAGQSLRVRWVLAKDACGTGGPSTGWWIDDVSVYVAADCDADAVADIDEFSYRRSSGTFLDFGWLNEENFVLTAPPQASGPVTLEFLVGGDFLGEDEFADIFLNNTNVGRILQVAGVDCGATSMRAALSVPAATWNAAASSGTVTILMAASPFVTTFDCNGSYIGVNVSYPLAVADADGDGILDGCDCPTVTAQPQPVTLTVGGNANFSATAVGMATLAYQWRAGTTDLVDGPSAGGGVISGANTPNLTITGVGLGDAGPYTLRVTNPCGFTDSSAAGLTVNPACPTVGDQPDPVVLYAGDDASFSVQALGTAPFTYQWRLEGNDLVDGPSAGGGTVTGATSATLQILDAGLLDAGDYDVVITNACGSITSDAAALTVNPVCPVVTAHPQPRSPDVGQNAQFSVSAAGLATLTYQWRRGNVDLADGPSIGGGVISGATTSTLTITGVGFDDAGAYDVVVTNSCGSATSNPAALTVNHICPTYFMQPSPVTIEPGQNAQFSVIVNGTAPFSYQWRRNGDNLVNGPSVGGGVISGADTSTLQITGAGVADSGAYDVIAGNPCGSAPSDPAALTVAVACPADFNNNDILSVQDIFDFLAAYFDGDPAADFNGGGLGVQDIFDFLAAYFTGCA